MRPGEGNLLLLLMWGLQRTTARCVSFNIKYRRLCVVNVTDYKGFKERENVIDDRMLCTLVCGLIPKRGPTFFVECGGPGRVSGSAAARNLFQPLASHNLGKYVFFCSSLVHF